MKLATLSNGSPVHGLTNYKYYGKTILDTLCGKGYIPAMHRSVGLQREVTCKLCKRVMEKNNG